MCSEERRGDKSAFKRWFFREGRRVGRGELGRKVEIAATKAAS